MTDGQPSGDSRTGRRLFHALRACGAEVLAAGSSDWVVHPVGGAYLHDEAYFSDVFYTSWNRRCAGIQNWTMVSLRTGSPIAGGRLSAGSWCMWRISWIIVGVWVGLRAIRPQNRRCRCVDGDRKSQHELLSSPKYHAARRLSLKRNSPLPGISSWQWDSRAMAQQMQMSQKSRSGRENLQSAEAKSYNQPKVKVAISRR